MAALSAALEALLHNAIEASAEGDEVELHTVWHPAARELHVVVTDRGEGIASERAPNVFRTFYSTRHATGVGLTLDHRAGFVLSLIDGGSSIEDIIDVSTMPTFEVLRTLYVLLSQNVIALRRPRR